MGALATQSVGETEPMTDHVFRMTTTMHAELEHLEARRRDLSFQVGQGNETAEVELDQVEDQLGRIRRDLERAALAAEEAQLRAEAEAAAKLEAERQAQVAQLKATLGAQIAAAADIEVAADMLCRALDSYLKLGQQAYTLSNGRRAVLGDRQARAYLSWRLGEILPGLCGPKPIHEQRRPLGELLIGATE